MVQQVEKLFPDLLLAAEEDDAEFLIDTVNSIDRSLVECLSPYNIDERPLSKILDEMKYAILSFPFPIFRYERIKELYKKFRGLYSSIRVQHGDLKFVLEFFHDDFLRTFEEGFLSYNVDDIVSLKEKGRLFKMLDVRIRKEKPELYNDYLFARKELDRCLPLLSKLKVITRNGKPSTFQSENVNSITEAFSSFFSALSGLIGKFEALEINLPTGENVVQGYESNQVIEKGKDELEDLKEESLRNTIWKLAFRKEDPWDFRRIGQHLSMTEDEIKEVLGVNDDEEGE